LDYCGSGILVNEIERFFRIDDRILKYMTVVLNKDVDIETVKEEIARIEDAQTDETASSDENSDVEPDVESNAADEPEPVILENNPS
jgi:small subunit ribosomal protein S6